MGAIEASKLAGLHDSESPESVRPARNVENEYRNYKRLVDRAIEVFGDDLTASRWLSMPSVDLGGKVPLQIAISVHYDYPQMEAIFEPIFIRIEHGIYW
jgi:uncharacterized protein (DUF2384 family)